VRQIGLHLHIDDSLEALVHQAGRLNLSFFQCFLALKNAGRLIRFSDDDMQKFTSLWRARFDDIFLHSSYWVNLSATDRTHHPLLYKELALAKKLGFTHLVFHAGSAKGARNRNESIKALARSINWLLENNHGMTVVLENTAHGGNAVGSDLRDFRALLKMVDNPAALKFCIDIAHAYLFGYDIVSQQGQKQFIDLVDEILGWQNVVLIHLNDTQEKQGSKIDKHYSTGDGNIGNDALRRFIMNPKVVAIPVIMEMPMLPEQQQKELLEKVTGWHNG